MSTKHHREASPKDGKTPAILFDLDGTLVDSNYEHVLAWSLAFGTAGIQASNAFVHRRIAMRGHLLTGAVFQYLGLRERSKNHLQESPKKYFDKTLSSVKPL